MSLKQQMSIPSRGRETRSCQNGRTLMRGFTDVGRGRHSRRAAPTDLGPRGGGEPRLSSSQRSVSLRTWVARRMPRSSVAADIRRVVRRSARRWHRAATSHLTSHSSVSVNELYCSRTGLFAPAIKPKTLPAVVSKRTAQRSSTLTLSGSSPHERFFTYSPRVEPAVTGTDSDPAVRTNWAGAFCPRRSCSVLVGNSKPSVFVTSAVTRR